ncbi:MAG: methyl-accepting chemotaxis protein [Clostridia bacterium]|nr:methyl-accepting chemotaxis protein [Clostridia bacterium]
MKIKTKLLSGFSIIIFILIFSSVISLNAFRYFSNSMSEFTQYSIPLTNLSLNASKNLVSAREHIQKAVNSGSKEETAKNLDEAKNYLNTLPDVIDTLESKYNGEKRNIELIKYHVSLLSSTRDSLFNILNKDADSSSISILREEYERNSDAAEKRLAAISEEIAVMSVEYIDTQNEFRMKITAAIVIVSAINVLLALIISMALARQIIRPVKVISGAFEEFSQGNLKVKLDYCSNDEIGNLCESFAETSSTIRGYIDSISNVLHELSAGNLAADTNLYFKGDFEDLEISIKNIASSLNSTIYDINESAENVSESSNQLSLQSKDLSESSIRQSEATRALSDKVASISEKTRENLSDAEYSLEVSKRAFQSTDSTDRSIKQLSEAIRDIETNSNEIQKIIRSIEDIAFHTNILAINAAIESARAGEAGRGFFVVANEVRNLALKSTQASKVTSELIKRTMESVENGLRASIATEESIARTVDDSRAITELVERIYDASSQQSSDIMDIEDSIKEISSITVRNSHASEESSFSSRELALQAQHLRDLVEAFNIRAYDFEDSVI